MKRMAQFRYTKDNSIRNVKEEDLLRGNIFEKYPSISKLGI
jgi:hypothetical protein